MAPAADELNEHFDDRFLSALPPPALIEAISRVAADLREGEPVVLGQTPVQAYVELKGVQYLAVVEAGLRPLVELAFTQSSKPVVISGASEGESDDETSFRYLLMPRRLLS